MPMTGFICHDDYYDRLKRLTNEEVGSLFRQLMLYHAGRYDEMSDFIGGEGIAFDFIVSDIDRIEEKHITISEANRINGSKGGRPKKQSDPSESEENRNKPNESEENQTKPYKDKDKDIDKENIEKEKEREKEREKALAEKFGRFWAAYPRHEDKKKAEIAFRNINPDEDLLQRMLDAIEKQKASPQWKENGTQFIPHPTTWLHGNRWEDEVQQGKSSAKKQVPAQQYAQRDYTPARSIKDVYASLEQKLGVST